MNRKRYFQELSSKEKYPVGKLSPELRKALNLKNDMLPFWIYRMRVLGYPPAWMKEAEMSTTLEVIEATGSNDRCSIQKNPFSGLGEEGEIKDADRQYNKDSLIEFPGFNAPVPDNVKDDWLILGMPPLIMKQQLSEAVKSMTFVEPVPYKKAKLDVSTSSNVSQILSSPSSPDPCASADAETTTTIGDKDFRNTSEQPSKAEFSENENTNGDSEKSAEKVVNNSTNNIETNLEKDKDDESPERKLTVISMGTPVPQSMKPGIPSLEKWAVGMGELLHFENLPTSTGAYKDKIKGVIDKVRNRFGKEPIEK